MQFEHAIHAIDTGFYRPRFDAAHLIVEKGRGAFIDCGVNDSLPRMLGALEQAGLQASDIDWLILTHVHLDHAGGAGLLMQSLPNARLVVHPRGARHMIDPSVLIAGASAVYGEQEVRDTYGDLVPVPAERVIEAPDGHQIDLAGRELLCLDTPGHARHHLCVWDKRSQSCFTGDTFGLSYREFDTERGAFILPTSTPVQFDPEALRTSVQRMLSYAPQAMFLTHYSRVTPVAELAERLLEILDRMVELAKELKDAGEERHQRLVSGLRKLYLQRLREHGCTLDDETILALLEMDIELNAQGISVWLDQPPRR